MTIQKWWLTYECLWVLKAPFTATLSCPNLRAHGSPENLWAPGASMEAPQGDLLERLRDVNFESPLMHSKEAKGMLFNTEHNARLKRNSKLTEIVLICSLPFPFCLYWGEFLFRSFFKFYWHVYQNLVWKFCEKPDDFVLVELYTILNTLIENSEVCLTRKSVIFRVHEFTL